MCMRRAISKRYWNDTAELNFSSQDLRWNWTERSKPGLGTCFFIESGEHVVTHYPYVLVEVDIYKRSSTYPSSVLIELAKGKSTG